MGLSSPIVSRLVEEHKSATLIHRLLITLVVFLAFYQVIPNYFTGEDFGWVKSGIVDSWRDIAAFYELPRDRFDIYRPLVHTAFALQYPFFGLDPRGYHVISILLHLGSALMTYDLAIIISESRKVGLLAGLLFALQPNSVQVVAWLSCWQNAMNTFFYLLAVLLYLRMVRSSDKAQGVRLGFALVSFVLALLSLESAITLPGVLLASELLFQFRREPPRLALRAMTRRLLPFFAIAFLMISMRMSVPPVTEGYLTYQLGWNVPRNFLSYTISLLEPLDIYGHAFLDSRPPFLRAILLAGVLLTAFIGGYKLVLKSERVMQFSIAWIVITLLPTILIGEPNSNLLVQNASTGTPLDLIPTNLIRLASEERYTYTPTVGFCIAVAWFIHVYLGRVRLGRLKPVLQVGTSVAILIVYLMVVHGKNVHWRRAGDVAHAILRQVQTAHPSFPANSKLYFVNLPDNIEGAYVYRNGIQEAIVLTYGAASLEAVSIPLEQMGDKRNLGEGEYLFEYVDGHIIEHTRGR